MSSLHFMLATANSDKAQEILEVLRAVGDDLRIDPRDPSLPEVEETGATLEENARLKAQAMCDATGLPAIADDTGLEVDALGGAPGVSTARFAGEDATYADNVALLLERLEGVEAPARTARFSTVAIARWPDGREVAAFGTVEGSIADSAPGGRGVRLRPGVRARRVRRTDVRGAGTCGEACRVASGSRVPYPHGGAAHRGGDRRGLNAPDATRSEEATDMAVIDIAGFVADLKDHAVEHGFHVHDERHFVESYSLRQTWEVDAHPEEGCDGPVDLYLSLEVDPRVLLGFEDMVMLLPEGEDPLDEYRFP